MAQRRQRLTDLSRGLPRPDTLLDTPRQRFDRVAERLDSALRNAVQAKRMDEARLSGRLQLRMLSRRLLAERERLADRAARLDAALQRAVARKRDRFAGMEGRLRPGLLSQRLAQQQDSLARNARRLSNLGRAQTARWRDRIDGADRMLRSLGYQATLERGYAVIRAEGAVMTTQAAAAKHPVLEIQFSDGRLTVGSAGAKPRKTTKADEAPDQGSLF